MICFAPWRPLVSGQAGPAVESIVVVPARNEAATLARCLDSLAAQSCANGAPLSWDSFEVLLLLNNCTDGSAAAVRAWVAQNPGFPLHLAERRLPPARSHVGTARRWLMDTAWHRLCHRRPFGAILSTDADTTIAPDWIDANLAALHAGADVVGGAVHLGPAELAALDPAVRHRYRQDRRYAVAIAELEALLDPQPGDPAPRHLDHFGASLACRTSAYAAAGGLPDVSPLEDEAFIHRVRAAGLRLRHSPAVRVFTSARLQGRAPVGLSSLLQLWADLPSDQDHVVPSAALVEHRFRTLAQLRQIFETRSLGAFPLPTPWWENTFRQALDEQSTYPGFLAAIFCDVLIQERFQGQPHEPIEQAIASLRRSLEVLHSAVPCCVHTSRVSSPLSDGVSAPAWSVPAADAAALEAATPQ